VGKDTDSNKDPGMKDYEVWHAEKLRRESGYEEDHDGKARPDPLPLGKLRDMEARDGKVIHKVASRRMSLAEVNALILAFRKGDKKAETALYLRYIKRIKMLMRKSPWYSPLSSKYRLSRGNI